MAKTGDSSIFAQAMKKFKILIAIVLVATSAVGAFFAYQLLGPAFNGGAFSIRLHNNYNQDSLILQLEKAGLVNTKAARYWIPKLGYRKVRACSIQIPDGCSLYSLVNLLKENRYQTVNVTILGSMDERKLATLLKSKLEVNEDSFLQAIAGKNDLLPSAFNDTTWQALMLPNTYNFAVGTSTVGFFKRMNAEYQKFWNSNRLEKAKAQGLSPLQVSILASIVTKESNKTAEYNNIAGVYINRLRKGMLLQADPTVVYARKRSGRVLNADLRIPSAYNTYIHAGLPPGPIAIPNAAAVEAVLNYKEHNYLYFVANPTFDGYHHFSATLAEHNLWAAKLHRAMDARDKGK